MTIAKRKIYGITDRELFELSKKSRKNYQLVCKEFYRRFSVKINLYCIKVIGNRDDAEDVLQESFITFFEKLKQEENIRNVYGYLFRICRFKCIDFKRAKKHFISIDDTQSELAYEPDNDEFTGLVDKSLELLNDKERELFIMKVYNQMGYKEIAEIHDSTVSSVKNIVYRAKKKIRNVLSPFIEEKMGK